MTLQHALRSLQRTPVFTMVVILTLSLGIASVGSMFAIVYGVLLAPLPYGDPQRLISVGLQGAQLGEMGQPPALYFTYKQQAKSLDDIGFYRTGSSNLWVEGDGQAAESVIATWVTASMMPLLQVPPLLGRSFTADEEIRGGPDAVILSESEWRTSFNAAPDVIGQTLMVNSVRRQIVGVMPARFAFPTADTRVWLPAKQTGNPTVGEFIYQGVGRLAPGATAEQAQRELTAILPRMAEAFPRLESGSSTVTWLADMKPMPVVLGLRDKLTGDIARTLWMLAATAALVLLVAWANVANLMLIRADGRQPELAVRAVLGASRLQTAMHFLEEALLLGVCAGAIALPVAAGAVRALVAFGPANVPRLAELDVGLPAVAFIALSTAIGVIVCTAVPAGRFLRASLPHGLREGGRGSSTDKLRLRLRAAITILQIALALVVSIGSALLLRTAHRLSQVRPGFDTAQVITLRTQLPFARYDEAAGVAFYARLTERVRQLPSVRSAGVTTKVPLGSGDTSTRNFTIEGEGQARPLPIHIVDDGYFAAMGIPLIAGRGFRPIDQERGSDIILSRHAAETVFGDADAASAVGKRLALAESGLAYTIIGVVGDVRDQDLTIAPSPLVYRPPVVPTDPSAEPAAPRNMALVVKASGPADAVMTGIRQIMRELDPTVPIYNVELMDDVVRASTARLSLVLTLMTIAAAITLLLGAIGLYALVSYMVALRTREFGIRVALGADPKRIARLVAGQGLVLIVSGVAGGFIVYAMAAPFLRAFLYGVTETDRTTLLLTTLLLVATASFATWLPARRAAHVDPMVALRAE